MEKRWSERKELSLGVDVYQHGQLLGSGFSHDIGLGGAFLGINTPLEILNDTDVELIFFLASSGQGARHKINAKVTRVSEQGVGFKFCDFDTGVFRSLQEIMSYKVQRSDDNKSTSSGKLH